MRSSRSSQKARCYQDSSGEHSNRILGEKKRRKEGRNWWDKCKRRKFPSCETTGICSCIRSDSASLICQATTLEATSRNVTKRHKSTHSLIPHEQRIHLQSIARHWRESLDWNQSASYSLARNCGGLRRTRNCKVRRQDVYKASCIVSRSHSFSCPKLMKSL